MARSYCAQSVAWNPVRPEIARNIQGKTLLEGAAKIVLTRVEPQGAFASHRDDYDHLFYFLSGRGVVSVEGRTFDALPGLVVEISAGEEHSYANTGREDLILISANIYK